MPATATASPAPDAFDPSVNMALLANLEAALSALLTASEPHEPDAPAARAYRHAMRARGQDAAQAGGAGALAYLLARLTDTTPGRAEAREAILDLAWFDLPGWRS